MTLRQTLHQIQAWKSRAKLVPLDFLTCFGLGFSPETLLYSMIYFLFQEIVGELFGKFSSLLRRWRVGWSVGDQDPSHQPMGMLAGSNVEHRQDQNFAGMQSNLNMDSDWNMIDTPISSLPPADPLASGAVVALDQHQSSSSCQKNINVDGIDLRDLDNEDQSYVTKAGSRGSVRPRTGAKRDRY